VARYQLFRGDGIAFMAERRPGSVQAIVTDPPYGLREYEPAEQRKLRRGRGGVWRIPPALGGHVRSPLPRFTVLTEADRGRLGAFFLRFAQAAMHVLAPGGHVLIATHPLLSHLVYAPLLASGFEKRGEIARLVQTLRGGDRPKNAESEFPGVTVMPRSAWEPWGVFRKPCQGRVQDNLRRFGTGGLRRTGEDLPFTDVIRSAPTRASERALSPHPSLKPQAFMRRVVHAALPLGRGWLLDPFMGGGSTIAAAVAVGYPSLGVELDPRYFALAERAIPGLASLIPNEPVLGRDLPKPARARR
jgi:site-specific DNA-methyltransferase (adenine-specific)